MTLYRLLLLAMTPVLAAPGSAAVRLVEVAAAPFEGLHSRFEVTVYLDRPGEIVVLRLFEMPKDGDEHEIACWRVADKKDQAAGGGCPSLPDDELSGGTVVVEVLRSLPLSRYRIEATGEDDVTKAGSLIDTRGFPARLAQRLAPARRGKTPASVGLTRLDPEDVDGVSGVRRFEIEPRARGMEIAFEPPNSDASFVFGLLGPDGLVWEEVSAEPAVTYNGPTLAPGEYFWLVRSTDPETILVLPDLPRLRIFDGPQARMPKSRSSSSAVLAVS